MKRKMAFPLMRSETLQHGTLVIPLEDAHSTLLKLGLRFNAHFEDEMKLSMSRPYNSMLQRIESMELKIARVLQHIESLPNAKISKCSSEIFLKYGYELYDLTNVEESLNEAYTRLLELRLNNSALLEDRNKTLEEWCVNMFVVQLRMTNALEHTMETSSTPSLAVDGSSINQSVDIREVLQYQPSDRFRSEMRLSMLAGTLQSEMRHRFLRSILLISRGSAYVAIKEMKQLVDAALPVVDCEKDVFFIYFHGCEGTYLYDCLYKLCVAFNTNLVNACGTVDAAMSRITALQSLYDEKEKTVDAYVQYMKREVSGLLEATSEEGNSLIEDWRLFCMTEKSIYATLNKFQTSESLVRCGCWFLETERDKFKDILNEEEGSRAFLIVDDEKLVMNPPTYLKNNEFIFPFQLIVNMYGLPNYKEVNAGLFTIIFFPFLFGVMFGDVGHGLLLLLLGIYLVCIKPEKAEGALSSAHMARYLILLMGVFSVFCGSLYNEFFGVGFDLFGSRWIPNGGGGGGGYTPDVSRGFPYPFGVDPMWRASPNELMMSNSLKMKFAIIVAFIQMLLGICLKGADVVYRRDYLTLYGVVTPQIVVFMCFVGYLLFLIVYKWVTSPLSSNKPSLISTFIGVFLMQEIRVSDQLYSGQGGVQTVVLTLMVLSVPIMFGVKPLLQFVIPNTRYSLTRHVQETVETEGAYTSLSVGETTSEEKHSPMEELMHHFIECTEFLLSLLSNTASYLRLWALSLAHSQLSKIILDQVFLLLFNLSDSLPLRVLLLYVGCSAFCVLTAGIIMFMDFIEAFLHSVRLQWVEFQNKFYKGEGYPFKPFSFSQLLEGRSADDE